MRMQTGKPTAKVTAATLGAAVAGLLAWGLNTFVLGEGQRLGPEEVAMLATVAAFLCGYVVRPSTGDGLTETEPGRSGDEHGTTAL